MNYLFSVLNRLNIRLIDCTATSPSKLFVLTDDKAALRSIKVERVSEVVSRDSTITSIFAAIFDENARESRTKTKNISIFSGVYIVAKVRGQIFNQLLKPIDAGSRQTPFLICRNSQQDKLKKNGLKYLMKKQQVGCLSVKITLEMMQMVINQFHYPSKHFSGVRQGVLIN